MGNLDKMASPFLCEDKSDCGYGAECVKLQDEQPKHCFCVNYLTSPNKETGDCDAPETEQQTHSHNGVISHEQVKKIFNVTLGRVQNEAGTEESNHYVVVVPAFLGFFLVLLVVGCVLRKKKALKRTGDGIARNGDGVLLLDRMNNISRNPTYFYPNGCLVRHNNVREVPLDQLKLLERVGEGAFGQVFKGYLYMPESQEYVQVAVKVLKDGASHETYEDFQREVDIMASFNHENILKLMGVVTHGSEGNPYMIFEFMEHGDLNEFLRRTDPQYRSAGSDKKCTMLSKVDLVDFSVQIAQGMEYLAGQRFIHRDLATRNCLVASSKVVKISDFGMSRDVYNNDYYKIGGSRMVPVRWLSPEAVKFGRFTTESDIWAYGVTLWEIFSYGKQPYYGHANEEVINFLDQGILLQRPEDCPSTIYHVMLGCWRRDPRQRLEFNRLVKHLVEYKAVVQATSGHHNSTGQKKEPPSPLLSEQVVKACLTESGHENKPLRVGIVDGQQQKRNEENSLKSGGENIDGKLYSQLTRSRSRSTGEVVKKYNGEIVRRRSEIAMKENCNLLEENGTLLLLSSSTNTKFDFVPVKKINNTVCAENKKIVDTDYKNISLPKLLDSDGCQETLSSFRTGSKRRAAKNGITSSKFGHIMSNSILCTQKFGRPERRALLNTYSNSINELNSSRSTMSIPGTMTSSSLRMPRTNQQPSPSSTLVSYNQCLSDQKFDNTNRHKSFSAEVLHPKHNGE